MPLGWESNIKHTVDLENFRGEIKVRDEKSQGTPPSMKH